MTSGGFIEDPGLIYDTISEKFAQILRRSQVDSFPPQNRGQLSFHPRESDESRHMVLFKNNEHINIAIRPIILSQGRTKK